MIPILFEKNETTFTTNGLGRLNCIRCIVTEERNGIYECEFDLPVSDPMFNEVQIGRIIACTHDEEGDLQPFDIYKVSEPINGIVTFNAAHISYRLNEITVEPFYETTCALAMAGLGTNSVGTNPFSFNTNKSVFSLFTVEIPSACRSLLGGVQGSILDVYGGEFKFDKWSVYLYGNRGIDTDVSIRYGKNIIDFQNELDYSTSYNAVVPFWKGSVYDDEEGTETEVLVTLPEKYISSGDILPSGRTVIIPMDLSGDFVSEPTENELRTLATSRLSNSYAWLPDQNIKVDFVQLWQTEEYKDLAPLQTVKLCDTVLVDVPMYNVTNLRIKVIKVIWNALLERYDEMELGNPQTTLAGAINESSKIPEQIVEIARQTLANMQIADNTNQHFWFTGSGTDTGAHITEIAREDFLNDPSNGGGNLLARSNGIAVRDGLVELATFGSNGMRMGKVDEKHIEVLSNAFNVYDEDGSVPFSISTADSLTTETVTRMNRCSGSSGVFIFKHIYLRGLLQDNKLYVNASATTPPSTYTQYITVPTTGSASIEIDGIKITAFYDQPSTIAVSISKTVPQSAPYYVGWQYTESYYETNVKVNDASLEVKYDNEIAYLDAIGKTQNWEIVTYGKVASLYFELYDSDRSVSKGGYLYEGMLLSHAPKVFTSLVAQAGSAGAMIGYITPAGEIKIVQTGGNSLHINPPYTMPLKVSATYILQ